MTNICRTKAKTIGEKFGRFNSKKTWMMATATIKSRWDYFEKGDKRGKYTARVKSEW